MLLCGFKIQILNSMFVLINLIYDTSRMGTLKLSVFFVSNNFGTCTSHLDTLKC